MQKRNKLSVAIITFNEEDRLYETLQSVKKIADEIIIIDANSTDKTCDIAKKFSAKIFKRKWDNFASQKNFALSKCSNEFILSLDADEILSTYLQTAISVAINEDKSDGYIINRKTYYIDKLLMYSWQPDNKLRLVRKSSNPKWVGEKVHEYLTIDSHKVRKLDGYIIHKSYRDINDHNLKTIKYAKLSAEDYYEHGRRATFLKFHLSPIISFIKNYFFKLWCLDGAYGLIAATSAYTYTFYKYAYLYELTLNEKHSKNKANSKDKS